MINSTPSSRVAKVRFVSLVFRTFCRVLLALEVFIIVLGIGALLSQRPNPGVKPGLTVMGIQTGGWDLSAFLILAYWALGVWTLERLFNVFTTGELLDERAGKWLKFFGLWVATSMLFPVIIRLVQDLLASGPLGESWAEPAAYLGSRFLVGLFLIMLGWVLEEAGELKTEQELTV